MTQRNKTILSLCGVVLGAAIVNEIIRHSTSGESAADDQDRQLASFGERYEPKQIKWEQELARTVAKEPGSRTLLGKKPSPQDRLMYEVFEGHYQAHYDEGKLRKITLIPNQTPVSIKTEDLLQKHLPTYGEVLIGEAYKAFDHYQLDLGDQTAEVVHLKDKSDQSMAQLTILRDQQGRVIGLEVQQSNYIK